MESKIKNPRLSYFIKGLLFVAAIAIIVNLFPREDKFKYYYQNGKPWRYELLTAPFDFPIYKEEDQLKKERDSILKIILLYYDLKSDIDDNRISKFNKNFPANDEISNEYKKYIEDKLYYVYKVGILSSDDMEDLTKESRTQINVVENHFSNTIDVNKLFTVKSAYNYIINNIPYSLDVHVLKSYDLNNYLTENIFFNKKMTNQAIGESIKSISLTSGIVQAGERIIGRGEIINDNVFRELNSLKRETESRVSTGNKHTMLIVGQVLLVASLMFLLFLYLILFRPQTFANIRRVFFILMMIVIMVALSTFTIKYTIFNIYIVPFAILPILVRIFFDSRTALFVHIITVLLVSFMVVNPYEFLLLQITVGMATVSSLKDLTQRSQLMQVAGLIVLTYSLIFASYSLITDGDITKLNWRIFVYFIVNGTLLLFTYGVVYIFEKLFGFLSNVTLIELSNVNSPLMMKFSEVAPGTFQHSLQVASLATEAASKTNANSLLVRVGALYHDIGKMSNPMYFIENQGGRPNPLLQLEYDEAAQLIISHVADGVKIAQKNNLPNQIIEFIQTHHAQSKAKYFYNLFKNNCQDMEIDEKLFTYPGPKPSTREMAILMMADAVEAASRSLSEFTEESIDRMVEAIIDGQIAEGSFKNAPITFQHIEKIKKIFKQKLKNIYHSRINYPELKTKKKKEYGN